MDPQTDQANPGRAGDAQATSPRGSVGVLVGSCAVLALALLPFAAGAAWYGYGRSGQMGLVAAGIAFGTCWLSGSLALAATFFGQRLGGALHGVLLGMIFRMGLPLAVGLVLQKNSPPLSEARVFLMILGLYLVALVVETLLSLQFVPRGVAPKDTANCGSAKNAAKSIDILGVQSR